ncbi:2-dehydropantoate 2-reductase protein [Rutstroemia sp. NJR-2017a BBW]|nr:2-dehydropantoate 2-reductase protein [Rutstroemia sp. NJR-2017a BBW]
MQSGAKPADAEEVAKNRSLELGPLATPSRSENVEDPAEEAQYALADEGTQSTMLDQPFDLERESPSISRDETFQDTQQYAEVAQTGFVENLQPESAQQQMEDYGTTSEEVSITEDTIVDTQEVSRTIHILGTDPVGQFVAHGLAGLDFAPPITLLMDRPIQIKHWRAAGGAVKVRNQGLTSERSGFDVELTKDFGVQSKQAFKSSDEVINNLIITTKGAKTVAALTSIKHRLRSSSTICFIQHGAGVIDEINALVFPDPTTRPHYMLGNASHGVFPSDQPWTVSQVSHGQLKLTILPRDTDKSTGRGSVRRLDPGWAPSSRYMLMMLCRDPELRATGLLYPEYLKAHFEFVAVNSVISPLSVVFDCSCNQLLYNYPASQTMKSLLQEISGVLTILPEFENTPNITKHFGLDRLESLVLSVIARTGENLTTMLRNVRAGKRTDIDYYNGYIVKRAKELGVPFSVNEMVVNMVKAKQAMDDDLAQIRRARLEQLKSQGGGGRAAGPSSGGGQDENRQQQEEAARQSILNQILEPEAADRLGRIRLVKESRAADVENRLIMLARSGQLRQKITEDQLKELLGSVAESKKDEEKIVVSRRKGGWDDEDDDLLDL